MRNKVLQWLILIAVLVAAVYVVFTQVNGHSQSIRTGHSAPDFTLQQLDGGSVKLSDLKGKGVILNFWGTYCGPCREEMPALQKEYTKWKDKGIEVLGINTGEKSEVTIKSFVHQVGAKFPILLDSGLEVVHAYQVGPLPESVFIDKNGTVRVIQVGEMDESMIERYISRILP